jgi:HEXXH motif-containing protein
MVSPLALRPPRDLTIPDEGSTTAREVLSLSIRRLMGELRAMLRAMPCAPDERDETERFAAAVERLFAESPGAVASLLRRPTVSSVARCLRNALRPNGDRARALDLARSLRALVAFELALADALPTELRVTRAPSTLTSLGARAAVAIPADHTHVTFAAGAMTVHRAGGATRVDLTDPDALTRPYHAVEGGLVLALTDNNPLAMYEAHPDKQGNEIDLGAHPLDEWLSTLRQALALIAEYLPALRAEIDLFVQQLVPVGYDDHKHLSASYQESIGTIYLTLHPNLMTMTEAVIHEFSHNKINALFELDELLDNAYWPLYASPVRPDPRPLHGVILAVHAFQPVARLYEKMIAAGHPWSTKPDFLRRFEQVKKVNRDGAAVVLANAKPTPIGTGLFDEMRRWDEHYARSAPVEPLAAASL